ncbi:hypothetical protein AVEN_236799-1 [Araneus ventricosus]|uniref:Uncharacterized protein n=1 Tax=Araneus ventricosus TaxID=182803 RepID=A0A4Y2KAA4_ARAVE|nr:hypothetical protein AVEN_236799-1 [Araneus ventricosus]
MDRKQRGVGAAFCVCQRSTLPTDGLEPSLRNTVFPGQKSWLFAKQWNTPLPSQLSSGYSSRQPSQHQFSSKPKESQFNCGKSSSYSIVILHVKVVDPKPTLVTQGTKHTDWLR